MPTKFVHPASLKPDPHSTVIYLLDYLRRMENALGGIGRCRR
jgi:hypothetical protein